MYLRGLQKIVSFAVVLLLWFTPFGDGKKNRVARFTDSHFTQYGVQLPSREFSAALRKAAINISHLSCRKSLVLLGMANEEALRQTVPHFLDSMSRVRLSSGGQTLDGNVVLVVWSIEALQACVALQSRFRHQCVRDPEHGGTRGSFGFHDIKFHSLGFAKVKYILNGLSAGHDVVFLDTDIVVLRDPLPYFLTSAADVSGSMEKCQVYNTSLALHSREFLAQHQRPPAINIGVLYFRATAGVTRCVYNWAWDMHGEVQTRTRVWDQDSFGKVMLKCAGSHELQLKVLDPRVFQSGCFPGCGCTYQDQEVDSQRIGRFSKGFKKLSGGMCGPKHWSGWLMRHFPCSGLTSDKAELMRGLLDGFYGQVPARITHL